MPIREDLNDLGEQIRDDFVQNRRVMSFAEYLELVSGNPRHQLRSSPQYIRDCLDHYGSDQVDYPWGQVRRFKLFDCP
jgi:serine protein kinase